jgi:branched-chain amino acid transport system substrate-binding protein
MSNIKTRKVLGAVAAVAATALILGSTVSANAAAAPLKFGALLPQTGSLAFLGAPIQAGYQLAVDDINAAGGVNGQPVQLQIADEADSTTPAIVQASAKSLLSWGADVILGAASSSDSKNVINNIVAHKVVEISSSNTSPDFTTWKDNGFYFRTAPSDFAQGSVLGNQVVADGNRKVAILYQDSSYGQGLEGKLAETIKGKGATVTAALKFTTGESNFKSIVAKALAGGPDAIVLVSYDESKKAIPALKAAGFKGSKLYLVDGNTVDYSTSTFGKYLAGAQGTTPSAAEDKAFEARAVASYAKHNKGKKLTDFTYTASSYDAVVVAAIAAVEAKANDGTSIKGKLTGVTSGTEKVTSFKDAVAAIKAGKTPDYNGVSGPIDFDANGDPAGATIGVFKYDATGKPALVKIVAANAVK